MYVCMCVFVWVRVCVCVFVYVSVFVCAKMCHLWFCKDRMVAGELCKPVFSNKLSAKLINQKMCLQNVDKSWKLPYFYFSPFFLSYLFLNINAVSLYIDLSIYLQIYFISSIGMPKGGVVEWQYPTFLIEIRKASTLCTPVIYLSIIYLSIH